jgi:hypothetical protein
MFDNSDFDGLVFLVIANFYLKSLVQPIIIGIDLIMRSFPFAYDVEGVSRIDPDGFILRSMVDDVLAGEFQLSIIISPIKPYNATG